MLHSVPRADGHDAAESDAQLTDRAEAGPVCALSVLGDGCNGFFTPHPASASRLSSRRRTRRPRRKRSRCTGRPAVCARSRRSAMAPMHEPNEDPDVPAGGRGQGGRGRGQGGQMQADQAAEEERMAGS